MNPLKIWNVCIVGCGVAGLALAHELAKAEVSDVLLLDKGSSVGGRLATRRIGKGLADHGAQFISAHHRHFFATAIEDELKTGHIKPWFGVDHRRYISIDGMNQLAKRWAERLPSDYHCELHSHVSAIEENHGDWIIQGKSNNNDSSFKHVARLLVLSMPVPQTLDILQNVTLNHDELQQLEAITYQPCIALLIELDEHANIPAPGFIRREGLEDPLVWIADNRQKGISATSILTIHLSGEWSSTHYADADERIINTIVPRMTNWIEPEKIRQVQVKRWRYSQTTQRSSLPYLERSTGQPLFVIGDGFTSNPALHNEEQGRVETAYLSGLLAGQRIIEKYRTDFTL